MGANPWQREFDVAFRAVRDGAVPARDLRQHVGAGAMVKADHSPVTVADFAVKHLSPIGLPRRVQRFRWSRRKMRRRSGRQQGGGCSSWYSPPCGVPLLTWIRFVCST